jgi:hypothetical protein
MAAPSLASADVASTTATELRAEGLSVTSVTLETPPSTTTDLSETNDSAFTFDQHKPYLSPSHAAPLPILRVALALPAGSPLEGVLTTPGLSRPPATTADPVRLLWRLAVVSAARRVVANGTPLGGVQLDLAEPGQTQPDRFLFAAPDPGTFPARLSTAATMSVSDVRNSVEDALPGWVQPANLNVHEDVGGERVVKIAVDLPINAFSVLHVPSLRASLTAVQAELAPRGGRIGRTIVTITDSSTGDPLYVAADERNWGIQSLWMSPLVAGLEDVTQRVRREVPQEVASQRPGVPGVP